MWGHLMFVLPLLTSTWTIKVPVDYSNQNVTNDPNQPTKVYYLTDDTEDYRHPAASNSHKSDELVEVDIPSKYLTPPAQERQSDPYVLAEVDAQNEWIPITESERPSEIAIQAPFFINNLEAYNDDRKTLVPIPATYLQPPAVDAKNEYLSGPDPGEATNEQTLPEFKVQYGPHTPPNEPRRLRFNPVGPKVLPVLHPQPHAAKYPTKLYPKKFATVFKPVPIPISQFADDTLLEMPIAKPLTNFKPQPFQEIVQREHPDDKTLYEFAKAEHQRKLQQEASQFQPQQSADVTIQETNGGPTSVEQQTSETNFRYPGRNVYPAPVHQAPPPAPPRDVGPPAPDGRTEFRMHGMKGPHSYQFGYDTGKGKNRQFRYEERDNEGIVQGHYGYMDRNGKLRVVNYSAHPEYGFRAEEPQESN